MNHSETIIRRLQIQGERVTLVRRALLEILSAASSPFSAEELQTRLAARRIKINKTTAYRQLENLVRLAVLDEVRLGDRVVRYELASAEDSHHHHLICTACGKIEDVELPGDVSRYEKEIKRRKKFTVLRHSLEFFGLCKKCQ